MGAPIITIDGPVASGKGTVARRVAEALHFHLLDSGAIYRAHAQACLSKKIDFNEIDLLEQEARVLSQFSQAYVTDRAQSFVKAVNDLCKNGQETRPRGFD